MNTIDNIVGVSHSDLMVDYVSITLSIKKSLKERFNSIEEVMEYCKSLSYTVIYFYDIENGYFKVNI